jgi:hypothetical protein
MLEVDFSFGMYEARSDVGEGTFSNTELSEWVHKKRQYLIGSRGT